jgi:hypothetical protein
VIDSWLFVQEHFVPVAGVKDGMALAIDFSPMSLGKFRLTAQVRGSVSLATTTAGKPAWCVVVAD